ncbi:quinone oxidoreductase family protein [Oceanobacillus rekensis]|uniref:quinone oxidoreductase family protein n=1 Tax=Oceanobacillus rekensis TaxID=937927 RepID=UPI000B43F49B|nr:NADP-dependent oxidoreductase [Oceanobacillus rekensis]
MGEIKNSMKAIILNKFGGPEELMLDNIPLPDIGPDDVMIKVEYAGVGVWDIFEREGGYAEMLGIRPKFPYVLGSEGAGIVISLGENVRGFNIGDKVYAPGFLNTNGGFYAEYVALDSKYVTCIPDSITIEEASTISGVGLTALRGIEDTLRLEKGESVMIHGASGGVGHLAVQLAKIMGARVFAIASGEDGVGMMKKLGIDAVVNGHKDDVGLAARSFAPEGFDAALLTTGGEIANIAVQCVRTGGRIAYPYGIYPEPKFRPEIKSIGYYGDPDSEIIKRLYHYINTNKMTVHIEQTFLLKDARSAHLALNNHYLGKLCIVIND